MARKKKASFQNEYVIGFRIGEEVVQDNSHTVIAGSPSEAEAKFVSATGMESSVISNILKTGELAII